MTVAALYIDPRGPYPALSREYAALPLSATFGGNSGVTIDCWDASRDARLYDGPHPIVAHPPCKYWGRLRHLAKGCDLCAAGFPKKQSTHYGTQSLGMIPNTTCRDDRDCAPRAVEQVRRWGGVLEHPAGSLLWEHDHCPRNNRECGCNRLPKPGSGCDAVGGYTIEVDQCEWGHVARKRTWLYLVGVPREALEPPPFPGREPTHWISGGRGRAGKKAKTTPVPRGIKIASAQQRRRTPPLFAEYLIRLAHAAGASR